MASLLEIRRRAGRDGSKDTAAASGFAASLWIGLGAALTLFSCQSTAPSPADFARDLARLEAALDAPGADAAALESTGRVRVRLAFGTGADLDLYLTDGDPRSTETVYFAKHTTHIGGQLLVDARCGQAAPRIDAAAFETLPQGGLRIGVDYHASCAEPPRPQPFVVEIAHGTFRERRSGIAHPGHFDAQFWLYDPAAPD